MSTATSAARFLDRAVYLLLPIALLGPVFYLPRMLDEPFKVPAEVWIVIGAWLLTAAIGIARGLSGKSFLGGADGSTARRMLMALVGWILIACLIGLKPAASLAYFATFCAYMLGAQSVLGWLEEAPGRRPWLFGLIAVLAGLEIAIGFMQFLKVPFDAWAAYAPENGLLQGWLTFVGLTVKSGDPVGTLGNRNYVAELMALTVPVIMARALSARSLVAKAAFGAVAASGALAMIACGTRAAALGFVVGGVVAVGLVFGPAQLRPAAWWGNAKGRVAAVLVAVFLLAGVAAVGDRLVDKLNRPITTDISDDARVVNWKAAAGVWQAHVLTGIGPGMYKVVNVSELAKQNPEGLPKTVSNARFYQAHNEPLQSLTEIGLVGGLLLLAALLLWLREVRQNASLLPIQRLGLVWGVVAVIVASNFGFPFHIPLTAFAFLLLLAAGLAGSTGALPAAAAEAVAEPLLAGVPVEPVYVSPTQIEPDPSPIPEGRRLAYAAAIALVTGIAGTMAISHGVLPLYQASHYRWLGEQVDQKAKKTLGADILFELAAKHDRFKAPHVFEALQALLRKKRHAEILTTYDRYADEGLGTDALLVRAAALEAVGRKDEAIAAYKQVMAFYHGRHRNSRSARRRLVGLGQTVPPLPPREPQPGVAPKPEPTGGPTAVPDKAAGAPGKPKQPKPSASAE